MENNRRSDVTNKYLVLRGFYPDITRQIDSAYSNNPDNLLKTAQAKIDERETKSLTAIKQNPSMADSVW